MHTGPLIDLSDEADLLSKWQERVGVEQSPFGVLPTDQTLESSDSPGSKLDNRLIMQHQLVEHRERLHLIVGDWQTGRPADRQRRAIPCRGVSGSPGSFAPMQSYPLASRRSVHQG